MTNHEKMPIRSENEVGLAPQDKAVRNRAGTTDALVVSISDAAQRNNVNPPRAAAPAAARNDTPKDQTTHRWISAKIRRPTVTDADAYGQVLAWHCEGYATTIAIEFITSAFIEYTHWQTLDAGPDAFPKPFRRTAGVDIEQMLRDCVPGGHSVDPQIVCDSIRAWFDDSTGVMPR